MLAPRASSSFRGEDAAVLAAVQDAARRARQDITGTLTREPALQFSELFPRCLSALSQFTLPEPPTPDKALGAARAL